MSQRLPLSVHGVNNQLRERRKTARSRVDAFLHGNLPPEKIMHRYKTTGKWVGRAVGSIVPPSLTYATVKTLRQALRSPVMTDSQLQKVQQGLAALGWAVGGDVGDAVGSAAGRRALRRLALKLVQHHDYNTLPKQRLMQENIPTVTKAFDLSKRHKPSSFSLGIQKRQRAFNTQQASSMRSQVHKAGERRVAARAAAVKEGLTEDPVTIAFKKAYVFGKKALRLRRERRDAHHGLEPMPFPEQRYKKIKRHVQHNPAYHHLDKKEKDRIVYGRLRKLGWKPHRERRINRPGS